MRSILIAEDESRIAAFLEKGLLKNGYRSTIATDGAQALSFLDVENFDVLLLDIGLPVLDGWEVLSKLRKRNRPISIILLTARDEALEKVSEFSDIVDDYIAKPFRFQYLIDRIRNCLNENSKWAEKSFSYTCRVHPFSYSTRLEPKSNG